MADPAWFHSTLAQSVAALIGFVMAFTAAIYTNRQSSKNEEIRRIWDCLSRLRDDYLPPLKNLATIIYRRSDSSGNWFSAFDNFSEVDDSAIQDWATEQESTQSALAFGHLRRIIELLESIDTPSSITEVDFQKVLESIRELKSIFSPTNAGQELFEELSEGDIPYHQETYYWDNIFDSDSGMSDWFDRNIPQSDPRRNRTPPHIPAISGRNLYSLSILTEKFKDDFLRCVGDYIANFPGEDIFQNSVWVLRVSGILAFLGIFLPLMMLITVPESPDGLLPMIQPVWSIIAGNQFWIQTSLLLVVAYFAGRLIWIIAKMVRSPNS